MIWEPPPEGELACTCYQLDADGNYSRGPRPRQECQVLREYGGGKLTTAEGRRAAFAAHMDHVRQRARRNDA